MNKILGRTSILVGWWFGMVWTRWSFIFSQHPFHQLAFILFILFFKIFLFRKFLIRQEIESMSSPKQQRRPLHSLRSLSFFFGFYDFSVTACWEEWNQISDKNSVFYSFVYTVNFLRYLDIQCHIYNYKCSFHCGSVGSQLL